MRGINAQPRTAYGTEMVVNSSGNEMAVKQGPTSSKEQLPSLTALRGIAALWVVLYHYSVQSFPTLDISPYTSVLHKGYLAVDMFFMLSGFVMTHVYHKRFADSVSDNYWSFISARIARIYPLHVLVLLLFVATAAASHLTTSSLHDSLQNIPVHGSRSLEALVANIFMLQGLKAGNLSWNYPAWSISVEFIAYLLFPLALPVIWRASDRVKLLIGFCLVALLVILACLTRDNFDQWDGPITLLRCLPEFAIGSLLYCAYRAAPGNPWFARDAVAFGLVVTVVVALHADAPDLIVTLLFAGLILAAVLNSGSFSEWANAPALIWLGEISYSLYLIHGLLQFLADKALGNAGIRDPAILPTASSLILMAGMICLCLLAAHVSYSCIEIGCRRYLRKLLDSRKTVRPKTAALAPDYINGLVSHRKSI
jgi:peptidoglycan/LPS O-acetylase OafA/YrhL